MFTSLTGKDVAIAIVDSGIDATHPDVGTPAGGVNMPSLPDAGSVTTQDYADHVGHGTACAGIIRKIAPDARFYSVKVFHDASLTTSGAALARAIDWSVDHGVQIINCSLGTTNRHWLTALRGACQRASECGIVIVAAVHNEGLESYPAALPEVIRVAAGKCRDSFHYGYLPERDTFVAKGDQQRVAWVDPHYVFTGGTSLAAAHLTGLAARVLEKHPGARLEQLKGILIENASKEIPTLVTGKVEVYPSAQAFPDADSSRIPQSHTSSDFSWIRRAVLFPYNKEMHAVVRFRDLLSFEVTSVVDLVGRGVVGKDAGGVIGIAPVGLMIRNRLEDALEEADTLVLGHVGKLGGAFGRDLLRETLLQAIDRGKHIFSFSPVRRERYSDLLKRAESQELHVHSPEVRMTEADWTAYQAYRQAGRPVDVPVIGVFGTSPQQGKFTVQLALRRKLLQRDYVVGQIGTEPHAELFGCDFAFPNGHDGAVSLPLECYVPYLETRMLQLCDTRHPEIIIVGGQSGIIPHDLTTPSKTYSMPSLMFLLATKPDAYILTVNAMDDEHYIRESLQVMEAIGKGKTIMLAMSDKRKEIKAAYGRAKVVYSPMAPEELAGKLCSLEDRFGLPAAEVISEAGQEKLINTVIGFFAAAAPIVSAG